MAKENLEKDQVAGDPAEESKPKKKEVILKADNSLNSKAKKKYIAVCDFTTMKVDEETGELQSTQIKRKEEVTAAQVPQIWIDQALAQRFLISKEDLERLSGDELVRLGYRSLAKRKSE